MEKQPVDFAVLRAAFLTSKLYSKLGGIALIFGGFPTAIKLKHFELLWPLKRRSSACAHFSTKEEASAFMQATKEEVGAVGGRDVPEYLAHTIKSSHGPMIEARSRRRSTKPSKV